MHLHQSPLWHRAKTLHEDLLQEAHHQEKEYIGIWIEDALSYESIKKKEEEIKSKLQVYCPKFKLDSLIFYLFPQVFIN